RINKLRPSGGGDAPEAVYDGLRVACDTLSWRNYSRRIAILVGDAPPHRNCLCGLTSDSSTAILEQTNVVLYALGLTRHVDLDFADLAQRTGGSYYRANQGDLAIKKLQETLQNEFQDLAFDAQVLELCQTAGWTVDDICQTLETPISLVSASLSRLGRRGLLA
ncbi:MAG: hypothetical protein AAF485_23135, partial [Chloroflexota bacterium]